MTNWAENGQIDPSSFADHALKSFLSSSQCHTIYRGPPIYLERLEKGLYFSLNLEIRYKQTFRNVNIPYLKFEKSYKKNNYLTCIRWHWHALMQQVKRVPANPVNPVWNTKLFFLYPWRNSSSPARALGCSLCHLQYSAGVQTLKLSLSGRKIEREWERDDKRRMARWITEGGGWHRSFLALPTQTVACIAHIPTYL